MAIRHLGLEKKTKQISTKDQNNSEPTAKEAASLSAEVRFRFHARVLPVAL